MGPAGPPKFMKSHAAAVARALVPASVPTHGDACRACTVSLARRVFEAAVPRLTGVATKNGVAIKSVGTSVDAAGRSACATSADQVFAF